MGLSADWYKCRYLVDTLYFLIMELMVTYYATTVVFESQKSDLQQSYPPLQRLQSDFRDVQSDDSENPFPF